MLAALRGADLFCLAARVARDGDRDGLPNVIMEAMSQELPVVATAVGAIAEVVVAGVTGRLVAAEDPVALATALEALIRAPERRLRHGPAGPAARFWSSSRSRPASPGLAKRFGLAGAQREAA